MKLYFHGHNYKYAAEQMLLTLFPGQRPEYPDGPPAAGEDALVLSLHLGNAWATATAALTWRGKTCRKLRRCPLPPADPVVRDRALQHILKLAFYGAGTALLGCEPPWGALTGVRPVKLPTRALLAGATPAQAERELWDAYRVSPLRRALAMDCARASLAALDSLEKNQVSLYVGIPFCPTRCAYCSFVSADVGRSLKLIDPFLDALSREIGAAGRALEEAGLKAEGAHRLLRGRHPHHPVRRSAGPAHGGAGGADRPVRLHGVHRGGGPAGHHHGGKAGGARPPGVRPDLGEPPVHV